jgi:hypothetical protein
MASWKITLSNDTVVTREEATVRDFVGVAELLSADWRNVDPTIGPRELLAWMAVLEVNHGDGENFLVEMEKIMNMSMVDVIGRIEIASENAV